MLRTRLASCLAISPVGFKGVCGVTFLALLVVCAMASSSHAASVGPGTGQKFMLGNPLNQARGEEVVELVLPATLAALPRLAAIDGSTGAMLPVQRIAPDRILVLTSLAASEKRVITVREMPPGRAAPAAAARAFGRHVPERKDDFAWENDRIAFRMYGPALAAAGEVSSSIDVWAKRVREPVIDRWYGKDDYHTDHGEGLDFYAVGTSRGCGGLAMLDKEGMAVSGNFIRWRRLANGPLRVVFELDYDAWGRRGARVTETKRITLDAGSNFARIESHFMPADSDAVPVLPLAIGVKRSRADSIAREDAASWISVWGAEQGGHGRIGCAAILPGGGHVLEQDDHRLLTRVHDRSKPFVYYVGAAWSKGLDFATATAWNEHVAAYAERQSAPIEIAVVP